MIVNLLRILLLAAAVLALLLTPAFIEGPGGREIVPSGALIDAVAIAAIVAVGAWWWRDRRR